MEEQSVTRQPISSLRLLVKTSPFVFNRTHVSPRAFVRRYATCLKACNHRNCNVTLSARNRREKLSGLRHDWQTVFAAGDQRLLINVRRSVINVWRSVINVRRSLLSVRCSTFGDQRSLLNVCRSTFFAAATLRKLFRDSSATFFTRPRVHSSPTAISCLRI